MFIYENDNSLNLTLVDNKPVENPDIVIKGYKNGAAVIVGETVYGVKSGEEFDGKANTLVYQKDNKLAITFNGIKGIDEPEVTIDDKGNNVFDLVVGGELVTLSIVDNTIVPVTKSTKSTKKTAPVKVEEPETTPVVEEPTEVVED